VIIIFKPFAEDENVVFGDFDFNLPQSLVEKLEQGWAGKFKSHIFDISDKELLESFHCDIRFMKTVGLKRAGQLTLGMRTLYDFRENLVNYMAETGENQTICLETLQVKNMLKNSNFTKTFNLNYARKVLV